MSIKADYFNKLSPMAKQAMDVNQVGIEANIMPKYRVLTQDSFCFYGCLPEGGAPDSNGDEFDTLEEATEDAKHYVKSMAKWKVKEELIGDMPCFSTELPYLNDEGEPDNNGYRFVSAIVEEIKEQ